MGYDSIWRESVYSEVFCVHNSSALIHTHMANRIRFSNAKAICNGSLTIHPRHKTLHYSSSPKLLRLQNLVLSDFVKEHKMTYTVHT